MSKSGTAYKKTDGLYLHSSSQTTDGVWIASHPFRKLEANSTAAAMGEAVIQVIEASTSPVEHPTSWGDLFTPMLELAGAKSWRAFKKDAKCCGLEMEGEQLRITPQRSLGPNQGFEPILQETVEIPFAASPDQIGAALERAFLTCES